MTSLLYPDFISINEHGYEERLKDSRYPYNVESCIYIII